MVTREIPYPQGCGCDDVVVTQQWSDKHGRWLDTGIRKLPDQKPMTQLSGSHNKHARLSPSDSKRWTSCTASIAFQEANRHRVPRDTSSPEADEGTEAHDWAARVLTGEITIDQVPETGMRGAALREHVDSYCRHCVASIGNGATRSDIKTCIADAELGIDPPDHVFFVEEQIPNFYQPTEKGTADFVGVVATEGVVERFVGRDLKFGAGVLVTNSDNTQLAIYIYSAIQQLRGIYTFGPETLVELAVFQPRHREGAEQQPWVVTLSDLESFCRDIEYKAITAQEGANRVRAKIGSTGRDVEPAEILEAAPGVQFAPSEGDGGACRWCKCKAFCSKRLAANTEGMRISTMSAEDMLSLMPVLDKEDRKLPVETRVTAVSEILGCGTLVTDEYLVNVLARAKGIKAWLADVEEYLEARLLSGEEIPGVKLVLGREGNREWANEAEADTFLKGQGLKQEDRYDFKLKSPAQVEKMLKEKLKKTTRTKNRFEELIVRSPASKKITIAEDERPATAPSIALMPGLDPLDDFEV